MFHGPISTSRRRTGALCVLALLCALLAALAPRARAEDGSQNFTLQNRLGVTIRAIYLSPHDQDRWGHDWLGSDVLHDGADVDIRFDPDEDADTWDLKVVTASGHTHEWYNFNLNEISWIKLYMRNGDAYARHN